MPIFEHDGLRVLYLHIPKTGGTTINNWLGGIVRRSFYSGSPPQGFKVTPQHLPLGDFRVLFGDDYFQWKFAVIRDPYDRLESEFFYLTHNVMRRTSRRPHFSTWVVNNLEGYRRNAFIHDNHLRPQLDFLDDDVTVFRFENGLERAAQVISERLGISPPESLPVTNARPRESVHWTLEALEKFNAIYGRDLEKLGYAVRDKVLDIQD